MSENTKTKDSAEPNCAELPTAEDLAVSQQLIEFIKSAPSVFHANKEIRTRLDKAGFEYLPESASWGITPGGSYYTTRNNSSVIAFKVGMDLENPHFQIAASHCDSPTYKVKSVPELEGPQDYIRLDVEAYGGMIDSTWFDRPLSLAGRVLVRNGDRIQSKLIDPKEDLLIIPSIAIHFNREVNDGYKFNRQVDLCPLFSAGALKQGGFAEMLAQKAECKPEDILGFDLFLVNRVEPRIWGWKQEFVSAPKLDDLQCAFASLEGFLQAQNPACIMVYACFDNEEVGSNTKQGAMSTLLHDTLVRLYAALGKNTEDYHRAVAQSFLVSCDNAHAVHPNHPDKTDDVNCSQLNGGIVIKESANQKYTTDAFSRAVFRGICERAGVPVQSFANRSDSAGGSTLGNLSNTQVSLHAVDIGMPQLAMHSSYETCGSRDTAWGIKALKAFYETKLRITGADEACI